MAPNNVLESPVIYIDEKGLMKSVQMYVSEFINNKQQSKITADEIINKSEQYGFTRNLVSKYVVKALIQIELNKVNSLKIDLGCSNYIKSFKSVVGRGAFGTVYKINSHECVKVVPLSGYARTRGVVNRLSKKIQREFEISKIAGDLGIGPKILKQHLCCADKYGECYAIMNMQYIKQSKTFREWYQSRPSLQAIETASRILNKKIDKMHKRAGILHQDLHDENVIVITGKNKNDVIDAMIIDFGLAVRISDVDELFSKDIDMYHMWNPSTDSFDTEEIIHYVIERLWGDKKVVFRP